MIARTLLDSILGHDAGDALANHLLRQRWFGGRDRAVTATSVVEAVEVSAAAPPLWVLLVEVGYAGGDEETYQVLLTRRPYDLAAVREPDDPRLVLASGDEVVYDALADAECVHALTAAMEAMRVVPGVRGELRCRAIDLVRSASPLDVRPLAREQSNTSVIRGDAELFKCMRRVTPGLSPELEMTQALTAAGFVGTAPPLGVIQYVVPDEEASLLLLVQPYLHNATEGWALALTSLRDLYAGAEEAGPGRDGAAMRQAVLEQGSTFVHEAARLGGVTAEMHAALISDHLPEAMRALPVTPEDLDGWAGTMTAELDRLLASGHGGLDPLRARRPEVVAAFQAVRDLRDAGLQIRHHGDYHLGQVLRTDAGWTVLDFEGEPVRSLDERRSRSSALRDVAGMLRSFDYAAAAALAERCAPGTPDFETLLDQGDAWAAVNRDAFWEAYLHRIGDSPLLPSGTGVLVLRRAFELQKAVYEVGYELRHRPDWMGIPLRFLLESTA